uniref:DoxX family protein n=1 Tax=Pelagibacter ubique TaxID=198252 RepID=UPI000AD06D49
MVNILDFLGRIFISALFLISAYNKIFNIDNSISWMEGYGVPGFLLYPTIVLEIILPIFVIIGY